MTTNDPANITPLPSPLPTPRVHTDRPEEAVQQLPAAPVDSPDCFFEWHGRRLLLFSPSREALFSQHRLSMGAPDLQRCLADLDAFFGDAARILWLCSHTDEDWGLLRCRAVQLQSAIDRWTDEHIPTHEASAATLLAFRIYAASRLVRL